MNNIINVIVIKYIGIGIFFDFFVNNFININDINLNVKLFVIEYVKSVNINVKNIGIFLVKFEKLIFVIGFIIIIFKIIRIGVVVNIGIVVKIGEKNNDKKNSVVIVSFVSFVFLFLVILVVDFINVIGVEVFKYVFIVDLIVFVVNILFVFKILFFLFK